MFRVERIDGYNGRTTVDAEWNYRDAGLNWTRAVSFLPRDARVWVRVDGFGDVVVSYTSHLSDECPACSRIGAGPLCKVHRDEPTPEPITGNYITVYHEGRTWVLTVAGEHHRYGFVDWRHGLGYFGAMFSLASVPVFVTTRKEVTW
jgi:hypothetical protein